MAKKAGLTGVVASPLEVERIKKEVGEDFKVLCPGIRPKWSATNDQKRIATPSEARRQTSDYIVVGRSITEAGNPREAYHTILREWEREL